MASSIASVLKQAIITFAGRKENFSNNLEHLKGLIDKVTAKDVDLHPQFAENNFWDKENKAPVTYIDIYEDNVVTMGIFILKPGMRLPLHDHPGMFGLIKVLTGTLRISSFTIINELEDYQKGGTLYPSILSVEKHSAILADSRSETCILEPNSRNLHEIESVGGPAAFLDVLSPPYETESLKYGPRKCTYFKIVHQISPKMFNLVETGQPSWFWSDSFPYTGPDLFEELVE